MQSAKIDDMTNSSGGGSDNNRLDIRRAHTFRTNFYRCYLSPYLVESEKMERDAFNLLWEPDIFKMKKKKKREKGNLIVIGD